MNLEDDVTGGKEKRDVYSVKDGKRHETDENKALSNLEKLFNNAC